MRPDEHKRRKNEKYKKKHDIPSGNTKDTEQKRNSKGGDSKEQNRNDQHKLTPGNQNKDSVRESEAEASPRRLGDNWERYEEDSDDDRFMPETRGEDFNKLLAESGGSASRFRFKDEEDWNDEYETTSQGLTMDFNVISQAISSIPLHERLNLSKDLFDDEQIDEMTRSADQCRKQYDSKTEEAGIKNYTTVKPIKHINTKIKEKPKTRYATSNETLNKSSSNGKMKPDKVDDSTQDSKSINKRLQPDISSLEDDLDCLLSCDVPGIDTVVEEKLPPVKTVIVEHPPESTNIKPNQKDKVKTEAIGSTEDWLDDLLGD